MIDVFDDVLEEHNAILIDDQIKNMAWKYNYHSNSPNLINTGMFYVGMTKKSAVN